MPNIGLVAVVIENVVKVVVGDVFDIVVKVLIVLLLIV